MGRPHILSALRLLGYEVAQATVATYMPKTHKPPSQTWRTFLDHHVREIVAMDFFTVPTLAFRVLYGFLVLRHDQRVVVHFHATDLEYYHTVCPHLSLERNAPIPRPKQVPSDGNVVAMPCVGGLHHGYRRVA